RHQSAIRAAYRRRGAKSKEKPKGYLGLKILWNSEIIHARWLETPLSCPPEPAQRSRTGLFERVLQVPGPARSEFRTVCVNGWSTIRKIPSETSQRSVAEQTQTPLQCWFS